MMNEKPDIKSNIMNHPVETTTIKLTLDSPAVEPVEIRAGDLCPKCGQAEIDYDGLLNLVCPECGYTLAGCFT
jgi:hypothetical protein